MKKLIESVIILITITTALTTAYVVGEMRAIEKFQQTIEDRALELPDYGYETDCYDWQDIEYVIFGEIQE